MASDAVATLRWQLQAVDRPPGVVEFRFHDVRKWRFDLAFPDQRVAVEVDGGGFVGGRHSTGAGMRRDCEKLSVAAAMGWRIVRVVPDQVVSGEALTWIMAALDWKPS